MYKIAELKLIPLTSDKKEGLENTEKLLTSLSNNGQILYGYMLEDHEDHYIARVVTTDDDSLDEKYYNEYVKRDIENIELSITIIANDAERSECCHCQNHSYYVLIIDIDDDISPVYCGDCRREIPLFKLPTLFNGKDHYEILNFQEMYRDVVNLWIKSLSDRFTKRQITDPNSALNKTGDEICRELENKTGKPVFYLLKNPIGGLWQYEKNNIPLSSCPKCRGGFRKIDKGIVDKVCDDCRLAFWEVTDD